MNMNKLASFLVFFLVLGCLQVAAQCALCPPDGDGDCIQDILGNCLGDPINPIDKGGGGGGSGGGSGGSGGNSAVPTAQEETAKTTMSFNANWNGVSGATHYYLYVSEYSSFTTNLSNYNGVEIGGGTGSGLEGPNGEPATVHTVLNLTPGKNYYYRVRSKGSNGVMSGYSNTITANTLINAPNALQENSHTTTSFKARWNSVSGAQSYRLDVSTSSNFSSILSNYNNKSVTGTSRTVSGLVPGRNYYYRVRAVGQHHTSSNSSKITANTNINAPAKIEEANRTNNSFQARWGAVSGRQYYMLDVSTSSTFSGGMIHSNLNVGTATTRTISGLVPGKNYYYRVRTKGAHVTSGYSAKVTANTSISAPTVAAESDNGPSGFTAKWNSVAGANHYYLYVSTADEDFSAEKLVDGYNGLNVSGLSASVTGLASGKNYYYKVKARGPNITSSFSNQRTAYTTINAPIPDIQSSTTTNGFTLNWQANPDADSYLVQVSTVVGDFASANLLPGYEGTSVPGNSVSITGLTPGKSYSFRVKSVGTAHSSGYSHPLTVSTTMTVPTAVEGSDLVANGFTANWLPVEHAQSYRLWVSTLDLNGDKVTLPNYEGKVVTGTSEVVTGLFTGKRHYYKVQATGENTTSTFSNEIITNSAMQVPVVLEESLVSETSFRANWQPILGATGYSLQVSNVPDFSIVLSEYALSGIGSDHKTITGLTYGTTYYYRVKAYGEDADSEYSNAITVYPLVKPGNISYTEQVCEGNAPGEISGEAPVGGNGSYEYRWQYYDGSTWQILAEGPNLQNYSPTMAINSSTLFKRSVRSADSDWEDSDLLPIEVYNIITNIGTLSATSSTICPGEYLEFSYAAAAGVNAGKTHLIGVKGGNEIDFGTISSTKSINVQEGYSYFVRYIEQQCTTQQYTTSSISFSFYENCNVPPSMDQNFVRTEVPKIPVTSQYELSVLDATEKSMSYTYSDGLGRPTMSVAVQAGQNFEDVIQFNEYDEEGRQEYTYLPYMDVKEIPGAYIETNAAKTEQANFYDPATSTHADIGHDTKPYSKTEWDLRGRVKSVVAPGEAWHAGSKQTVYDYDVFDPSQAESDPSSIHAPVIKWEVHNGLPRYFVNETSTIEPYLALELTISAVTDVEGRTSRSLTDSRGLAITAQIYDADQEKWVGSYNVYDDYGRVLFVIPPRLSEIAVPTQEQVDELAFQYVYDEKGRVIKERAPGAGWVEYVYDHWNRLVLTRHAAQVENCDIEGNNCDNYWTYFKYDALNRQIITGEIQDDRDRDQLHDAIALLNSENVRYEQWDDTNADGYTNDTAFPKSSLYTGADQMRIYTVNYFDNYNFLDIIGWDAEGQDYGLTNPNGFDDFGWAPDGYELVTQDKVIQDHRLVVVGEDPPVGDVEHNGKYATRPGVTITFAEGVVPGPQFEVINATAPFANVVNRPTGSKVKVLGAETFLNSVIYYDERGRVVQTVGENHIGGIDRVTNDQDWKGELQKRVLEHQSTDQSGTESELRLLSEYEYAHNGALLRTYETLNEDPRILVAEYHYNILGELVEKNVHSKDDGLQFLQSMDYRYDIRGAMTRINDADLGDGEEDLFGMEYYYETPLNINGTNTQPRFDGMVNAMVWNADNHPTGTSDFTKTGIGFAYDKQSRLSSTVYGTGASLNDAANADAYAMSVGGYDDNGNIQSLSRNSEGEEVDQLSYAYSDHSNKLKSVDDGSISASSAVGFDDPMTSGGSVTEYKYDLMGNTTMDVNKEIQKITYNHLQLVESIVFIDGTMVQYTYDAARNRLAKEVVDADNNSIAKVDYVGMVEYLDDEINQVFTAEGRAYKQNGEYHHEYFYTDHQGNNRVAFGILPERNVYTATMELSRESYEESHFEFPNDNIRSSAENHTPLGVGSVALNGTLPGREIGPAKVLTIATGDEVEIEVWAKYNSAFTDNSAVGGIISALTSAFGDASAGTGLEGQGTALTDALALPSASLFANDNSPDTETRAYLQYIFFDASYNFKEEGTNYQEVNSTSLGKFAKYGSGTLTFDEPGYLFVYLVNETNENQDVFFDDLKITHSSAIANFKVSQVNDFYPFGLPTANSWRSQGYVDPGLMYQSSYASYDSLTGYYDFLSRSYDPVLGRFFAVDPAGQFSSPYTGMGNIPHMGVDPNGEVFGPAISLLGGLLWNTAAALGQATVNYLNGNGSISDNLKSSGISTSVGFNTGSGWNLNSANGYGGFNTSQGGGIPFFTGLNYNDWTVGDSWNGLEYTHAYVPGIPHWNPLDKGSFLDYGADPVFVPGYKDAILSLQSSNLGGNTWGDLANFFKYTPVLGSTFRSSYQMSQGDYKSAGISFVSGAVELFTLGSASVGNQVIKTGTTTAARGSGSAYDGVRAASSYLQKAGVPRVYRKQILQSFNIETISLRTAGNSTFGLRFFGGSANASGRYLFPTFTNYTNRVGLALPYRWNSMTGISQFQIRPGATYIFGRAASQGGRFTGGSYQMYVNDLGNLIR